MPQTASNGSMIGSNTLITGGTFIQQHNVQVNTSGGGFEILQRATAPASFHDSVDRFDPPRCHPNTRTAILKRIVEWAMGRDASPETREAFMMWLYGPAGAGKSAIAQTISELCQQARTLLSVFFFSRTDPSRNHARSLVASITYQVIMHLPQAKDVIINLIEHDPLIFTRSIYTQFDTLLFQPLQALVERGEIGASPLLVVIDGLDECIDLDDQRSIWHAFLTAQTTGRLPLSSTVRFLIASRPEPHIVSFFNSQHSNIFRLALDDTYHANQDIRLFLHDKFAEITQTHLYGSQIPHGWPGEDVIEKLVEKSSGQFIYASTVVKYVSSVRHHPTKQLDIVLGLRPPRHQMPFAELDALYTRIVSSGEDLDVILQILALAVLGIEMTTISMEALLGLEDGDIPAMLADLASLVQCVPLSTLGTSPDLRVQIFHASLKDFFFDESRSKNLYMNIRLRHAEFAHLGFRYLEHKQNGASGAQYSEVIARNILQSLPHHLKQAVLTAQLHRDIQKLSAERLLRSFESQGWEFTGDLMSFWCSLIGSLKTLTGPGANELLEFHLKRFDQFLTTHLDAYFTEPYLTFLLTLIFVNPGTSTYIPMPPTSHIVDKDKYRLRILSASFRSRKVPLDGPYLTMLRDSLRNSGQYGANGLTSRHYASAVWYCLTDLQQSWRNVDALSNSDNFEAVQGQRRTRREHVDLPCLDYAEKFMEQASSTGLGLTLESIFPLNKRVLGIERVVKDIVLHLSSHDILGDFGGKYPNLRSLLEATLQRSELWSLEVGGSSSLLDIQRQRQRERLQEVVAGRESTSFYPMSFYDMPRYEYH